MVVVDDLLTLPVRGLLWLFREIQQAAQEELMNEVDAVTAELRNLYMRLETGRISEEEFAAQEKILLERLVRQPTDGGRRVAEDARQPIRDAQGEGKAR